MIVKKIWKIKEKDEVNFQKDNNNADDEDHEEEDFDDERE